jgi:hypothetical protein
MALSFTQADLDALKAALLTGATTVQIGDRTITYRSQKDLLAAMRMIENYLNGVDTDDSGPNTIQAGFSRGAE